MGLWRQEFDVNWNRPVHFVEKSQTDLGWSSALPLSGGVAPGKSLPFFEPQVPYLRRVNTSSIYYSRACFRSQIRTQ